MAYSALVTTINTRPHPNADRLQLGTVAGYQVVCGIDTQDGQLGVFFASDGQLSEEMCAANDLIGYTDPDTGEKKGGFFPKNRRVRAQRFRGEKSDGYWTPLESLAFTGFDVTKLSEGDQFTELNGVPVCNKYFTPATLRAMNGNAAKSRTNRLFAKHAETAQLKHEVDFLPYGSIVYVTEKLHGTSGRFGHVLDEKPRKTRWYHKLFGRQPKVDEEYTYMVGTRNVILADHTVPGFYGSEEFRWRAVQHLEGNLHKGEVLYFELVGYTTNIEPDGSGQLIMGRHDASKVKELAKVYGDEMVYKYAQVPGQCALYVYRITRVNEDGNPIELSWPQMKARCRELGINYVPEVEDFLVNPFVLTAENKQAFLDAVEEIIEGPSMVDPSHIKEGVCLRFEQPDGQTRILKAKSYNFGLMEGYIKEADDYVDTEEIS